MRKECENIAGEMEKAFFQRMRYIIGLKRKYKYKKNAAGYQKHHTFFKT